MALLLKGQDVRLKITQGGNLLSTLTDIKNFKWRFNLETLQEEFCGQNIPYFDDVFDGMSGEFSLATSEPSIMAMALAIVDRASNRNPDQQWNVVFLYAWPDGGNRLITIYDLKFKPIEMDNSGRKVRHWTNMSWVASRPPTITAV